MKKSLILELLAHLIIAIYAIYVGISQIGNGTFGNDATFWVSISLIFVGNSFISKLEVFKYETFIDYANAEAKRLLKEAIEAKKKFDNETQK